MKRLTYSTLAAIIAVPMLSGCGLRGDLERPEPIFEKPDEDASADAQTTDVASNRTVIRRNAQGGIIPDAAPTTAVNEGGLDDIE